MCTVKKRSYLIANAHAYMRMRIRNVRTYRLHHIYIYTARLLIEHPREWLASLADNIFIVYDNGWDWVVYLKSVENVITLGKLIGLLFLFCLPLLSILFLKTKRNDLARPVMGTIFLVSGLFYTSYSPVVSQDAAILARINGS